MTYDEKETLLGFLKGAFPRLTPEQIELYDAMLMMEDAEDASKAILSGINDWKFPPSWAEIVERIRPLRKARAGAVPREEEPIEGEVRGEVVSRIVPPWVKQWVYARHVIVPPDMRPFRESHMEDVRRGNEPVEGWMPTDLYLREASVITDDQARAAVKGGVDILDLLGPT